jgi:hypothetical protein
MNMNVPAWLLAAMLAFSPALPAAPTPTLPSSGSVVLLDIQGGIGPATRD